jgi:hypothetical protein
MLVALAKDEALAVDPRGPFRFSRITQVKRNSKPKASGWSLKRWMTAASA